MATTKTPPKPRKAPTPKKGSKKSRAAQIEDRRVKVAANLLAGMNYRDLATSLNVGIGTITRDVAAIMESWREEQIKDISDWQTMESRRIDRAINAIWMMVQEGDLKAIDRMISLLTLRARYYGLFAPDKIAPTDPTGKIALPGFEAALLRVYGDKVAPAPTPPQDTDDAPPRRNT